MKIYSVLGGAFFFAAATSVSATPIAMSPLSTNGCSGAVVTVSATSIDWAPDGGSSGCIVTGSAITYNSGTPLPIGTLGTILDLPAGPLPVLDFMTFTGHPDLHFDLLGIGPGPSNTDCASLANFEVCAAFAGSPFSLQLLNGQSVVSLGAFGVAYDAVAPNSTWSGSFSVTISDKTPAQIQAIILAGGSVQSTHAGNFTLVATPEPATLGITGLALLALGMFRKKLRK